MGVRVVHGGSRSCGPVGRPRSPACAASSAWEGVMPGFMAARERRYHPLSFPRQCLSAPPLLSVQGVPSGLFGECLGTKEALV